MPSNLSAAQTHRYQHRSGRESHRRQQRPTRELDLIADPEERRALLVAKQSLVRELQRSGLEVSRWGRRTLRALDQVIDRLGRVALA